MQFESNERDVDHIEYGFHTTKTCLSLTDLFTHLQHSGLLRNTRQPVIFSHANILAIDTVWPNVVNLDEPITLLFNIA